MSEKEDKNRLWLIRADNVILGPWTTEEVKKAVSGAVISLRDEIAGPCSFYRPVQEHPEFQSFAKTVRFSASLTKVITTITGKTTKSGLGGEDKTLTYGTQTDTETGEEKSALTADFKPLQETGAAGASGGRLSGAKGGSGGGVSGVRVPGVRVSGALPSTEAAAAEMESRSQTARKVQKTVKIMWGFCIAAALTLLGWIFYNEIFTDFQSRPKTSEAAETGLAAFQAGNERAAFQALKAKQKEERVFNDEEKQALAFLSLKRKDPETAAELVKTLPEAALSRPDGLLLQGLLALAESRFSEAESFFSKARSEAKNPIVQEAALINLAVLSSLALMSSLEGDWNFKGAVETGAVQTGAVRISGGQRRGILNYLEVLNGALSLLKEDHAEQEKKELTSKAKQRALQILNSGSPEYFAELYVLSAWLNRDDAKKREEYIKQALNQDPYFEPEYEARAGVYFADWSLLAPFCRDLDSKNSGRFPESGLLTLCLVKTGRLREAETFIGALRRQEAGEPLITALIAYYLMEKGGTDEAQSLLDSLSLSGAPFEQSALILKARIHNLKNERDSAIQALDILLKEDGGHVSGLGEKAKALFYKGDAQYKFYKDQALKRRPYYSELLFLEDPAAPPSGDFSPENP